MGHPGAVLRPCEELLALCDCNNFFVSCERLFRPDLEGRPVVVLSSNDGVVISRSNEAKAIGVKMGEPYFRVRSLLKRCEGAVFSSNFPLYEEISTRVMTVLRRLAPSAEVYSVDEAFLETPPEGKARPAEWGRDVRATVASETGIPISVGIAPTKTVAKLAVDRAKKQPDSGGAFALLPDAPWEKALGEVPVEDVWGIGRQWSAFLRRHGVATALHLRDARDDWLDKHLGVRGLCTAWELRGVRCFAIEEVEQPQKSIQSSRSFSSPVRDEESLAEAVTKFVLIAGRRLRSQRSLTERLSVSISTSRFKSPFYGAAEEALHERPTDNDIRLVRAATSALSTIFKAGWEYEKAAVCLMSLSSAKKAQLHLFGEKEDRGGALSHVADRLNNEAGRRLLLPAALLGEKSWRPKKERHSGIDLDDLRQLPPIS